MPIGGGQDLLARMKDYIAQPDRVVNVKTALDATVTPMPGGGLEDRRGDEDRRPGRARPGRQAVPGDVAAAIEVGTPQIRNQGTVGGNLNQRPRCWYFRNEEFVCFKKGGNRCFSPAGENQFHAIFGNGPSHIVHPSSLAVPSVAYGATFRLVGPNGRAEVTAADYFTMPTMQNVRNENVLAPNELLTHVILPAPGKVKSGHYEVRFKESHDWPIAFATVLLTMTGETVQSAPGGDGRGGAGAVAIGSGRGGAGRQADQRRDGRRRGSRRAAGSTPMSQNAYKVQVAKNRREAGHHERRRHRDRLSPREEAHGISHIAEDYCWASIACASAPRACTSLPWWTRRRQRSMILMRRPPTGASRHAERLRSGRPASPARHLSQRPRLLQGQGMRRSRQARPSPADGPAPVERLRPARGGSR